MEGVDARLAEIQRAVQTADAIWLNHPEHSAWAAQYDEAEQRVRELQQGYNETVALQSLGFISNQAANVQSNVQ